MKWIDIKIWFLKNILKIISRDHRSDNTIENDIKKFTHEQPVLFESDFGIVDHVYRTVPYNVWLIQTQNRHLLAADKHIVYSGGKSFYIDELTEGQYINTELGFEEIKKIKNLDAKVHMYDINVNSKSDLDHMYYANGVLSHNTTCASSYLLWKAMFYPGKTILIAANKQDTAIEIMDRIKLYYDNIVDRSTGKDAEWLKAGIVVSNRKEIHFDNGSKIVARATSKDSGRGLSVSILYCLGGETNVTVRDKITGEIKDISLENLYKELEQNEKL